MSAADRKPTPALVMTALGVVFGDLGTSPLYAMQAVVGSFGGTADRGAALGVLSLIVWALLLTVSVKYCVLVMRADNAGEGGILALMSLVTGSGHPRWVLTVMGLFGAALLYGDGAITPAISVLSALEGVGVVTKAVTPFVVPAAVVVLIGLFAAQVFGTARIGRVFGPVMLLWFATLAGIGAVWVVRRPEVLLAINPVYAGRLLVTHPGDALGILGGVFLVLTGGEALYADMGHVGRAPIRLAWYGAVLPALLLSYAGQTAMLLEGGGGKAGSNPFWATVPGWGVIPMVVLATLATVIASQAIITGAFSLTRQAMQLGWFPGMRIRQTSDQEYGQIYVPVVNWLMMAVTLALTVGFGSSDRLAGAYGTAVSATMLLTTLLLGTVMIERWGWSAARAGLVVVGLLVVDCAFFVANALKILDGGWIPLLLGAALFSLMLTWWSGMAALRRRLMDQVLEPADFLRRLIDGDIPRVPGTAVFLTRAAYAVPTVMVRHVEDMGALHKQIASLGVEFAAVPRVPEAERVHVVHVADGFWHVTSRFGFVEVPDVPAVLALARRHGCALSLQDAVYFAGRDTVVAAPRGDRLLWPGVRMVFAFLYRNALRTVDRFRLPAAQYVEIGRQIEL